MVSLKIAFVALVLLASIVDQVYSSSACFVCEHLSTKGNETIDCVNKPAHLKFAKSCTYGFKSEGGLLSFAKTDSDTKFKCATMKTMLDKDQYVFERGCIPTYISCDLIKNSLKADQKLEKCSICDGDLCNASSKAGIAIFTLISCLITSYVIFN